MMNARKSETVLGFLFLVLLLMSRDCVCKGVVAFVPLNNPEKVNFFFAGTFQQFWQKLIVFICLKVNHFNLVVLQKRMGFGWRG